MRKAFLSGVIALACCGFALVGRAEDTFKYEGMTYATGVNGLRDGKLSAMVGGSEKLYDLEKVQQITLESSPRFNEAEASRESDPKKAASFYREAIRGFNSAALKQLAEYRAIDPTDADGRWVDAINYFLDLYQTSPTDAIWKIRPTHMPAPSSSMLKESAERITAAVRSARTDEAKKNLKTLELAVYQQMGDTERAQRLAKEISTGIEEDPNAPKGREPDAATVASAGATQIEGLVRDKKYEEAARRIKALLPTAPGDVCVQLFALQARIYEEQGNLDLAAATWLRIPAHYPSSGAVPSALLRAAELEKRANHPAEARALFDEIVERHPEAKEAVTAKEQ